MLIRLYCPNIQGKGDTMSIFVTIEDKEGEQLASVFELKNLQRHFKHIANSTCLGFVSEAEDASFNQAQLSLLVAELEELEKRGLKKDEGDELTKLLGFCRKISGQKGSSIHFYAERDSER